MCTLNPERKIFNNKKREGEGEKAKKWPCGGRFKQSLNIFMAREAISVRFFLLPKGKSYHFELKPK